LLKYILLCILLAEIVAQDSEEIEMEKVATSQNIVEMFRPLWGAGVKLYNQSRFAGLRRIRKSWNTVPTSHVFHDVAAWFSLSKSECEDYEAHLLFKNTYLESVERVEYFRSEWQRLQQQLYADFSFERDVRTNWAGWQKLPAEEQVLYWKLKHDLEVSLKNFHSWARHAQIEKDAIALSKCPI
jgi:hypothetical protein